MKSLMKLAWRNLWRNRRRTIITISSICFAMFFGMVMKSMITGTYANLDAGMIKNSTGYLQIQQRDYWNDKTIDNTLELTPEIESALTTTQGISVQVPKLDYFALASTGNTTKGVAVIGTDAEVEKNMSNLNQKVVSGNYFNGEPGAALVPQDLAKYLELKVSDTLVLFGQGYHGVTAADKFWVQGIVDFKIPMMNKSLLYIQLPDAQELFGAYGRLTQMALMVDNPKKMKAIQKELRSKIDTSEYAVMNWQEMNAEYLELAGTKDVSSGLMIGVLYLIVGFGIFGTLFMMTLERRKEFSVMIAIGMKRSVLAIVVFFESVFLGVIGALVGVGLTLPLLVVLNRNPVPISGGVAEVYKSYGIDPEYHFALEWGFISNQFLVVFILCLVLSFVPIITVKRLQFVNALRGK